MTNAVPKQQCTDSIRPYSILTKLIFSVELWNCAIRFALNMEKSKKLHYYCISTYFCCNHRCLYNSEI